MKRQSVWAFIAVFFVTLACQTLSVAPSTPTTEPSPQVTERPSVSSDDLSLAGLVYGIYNENSGTLWQIGLDGSAYLIANSVSLTFSPDWTQSAFVDYTAQCSQLIDYNTNEVKPVDCLGPTSPGLAALDMVVGWLPGQPDTLLMLTGAPMEGMFFGSPEGYFGTFAISSGETDVIDSQNQVYLVEPSSDGSTVLLYSWSYFGFYSVGGGVEAFDPAQYGIGEFVVAHPTWSPNDKRIAVGLMNEQAELKYALGIIDLENKTARVLHPHSLATMGFFDGPYASPPPEQSPLPIWSPDGKWIAFSASIYDQDSNYDEVQSGWWSLRVDDETEYELEGDFESWSPDSQWLTYWKPVENDPGTFDLMAARPDGSEATRLTDTPTSDIYGSTLWSPDGSHLLFVDESNVIWIAETSVWQFSEVTEVVLPEGAGLFEWLPTLLPPYDELTVLDAPTPAPGADFSCPTAPRTRLQVGDTARITFTDGTSTFLRREPEAGDNLVDKLPEGTELEVIGGPVCYPRPGRNDAYVFWEVSAPSRNVKGWVAEGDLNVYYVEPWP